SKDEQQRLVDYLLIDIDIYKLGVLVALYTGMRLGELCALRWEDIDDDCIKVRQTMQRLSKNNGVGTELFIGTPKTETSVRLIPIPSFLKELIEEFRIRGAGEKYFLGSKDKHIVEPRVMQYKFKKYLLDAHIEKANFHALRHSFATRAVEVGFEIKSLSELLGHANVQITLQKYVHSSFALKQDNMELLKSVW
ncbi:MAG: site-specific integrase, partial [Oscillospiraceae bacterium]|nr:site-specific integrase [Oscillospiraceae bacterium]